MELKVEVVPWRGWGPGGSVEDNGVIGKSEHAPTARHGDLAWNTHMVWKE